MAYDNNQAYNKFLKKGCSEGCSDCDECNEGCDEKCSCCPAGLVAVYDEDGRHKGCLTPNDAELFQEQTAKLCKPGYIALYKTATSTFLGCVSETEFSTIYSTVNPAV